MNITWNLKSIFFFQKYMQSSTKEKYSTFSLVIGIYNEKNETKQNPKTNSFCW